MAKRGRNGNGPNGSGGSAANLGFEAKLWLAADPEERDEYLAHSVFWVPKEARWSYLQDRAKQSEIGKLVDDAMVAIERDDEREVDSSLLVAGGRSLASVLLERE